MKLIVNADDFGLTLGVSKAILKGLHEGILTDASALVSTPDFKESAQLALASGISRMGLHCLLTIGKPVLPPSHIPSLVNENGCFYSRKEFLQKDVDIREVEMELEAQIQCFLSTDLELNHIDTHHGFMNKTDEMTDLFIYLANKYQVPLRNEASRHGTKELVEYYKKQNVLLTDMVYFNTGIPYHRVDTVKEFLMKALSLYDTVELGCHPGYCDEKLKCISPLNEYREKELEMVLSPELKQFISESKIELLSYDCLGE